MTRALLIGKEPAAELGYDYVMETPYDAVVIGSLTLSQLLRFREERVLSALAEGKPVYLYTPGLPEAPKNRMLSGSLASAQRELKNWGVLFTDGGRKKLITAEEARGLRAAGKLPSPGAVIVGQCGRVTLPQGVIVAKRHIHLTPEDAARFGVRDKQTVKLKAYTSRPVIFEDVAVRVSPEFASYVHLDYDEANACGFRKGDLGRILP